MSLPYNSFRLRLLLVLVAAAVASPARAQVNESTSSVQGTGTATLERVPELLRLHVQLSAQGKSPAESLAALKDRRDAVKALLPTLGAAADSIRFDDPQVTRGDQQQKMNEMLAQRMGRTKRGSVAGETPTLPTTATATLTADWPLKSTDVEQLLSEAFALQEKIKTADVAGAKETAKLSPEEEELQAEMAQMMGGGQGPSPGEPQFTFVLKVTPDEKAKLTAEAFQKAKSEAARLATAADAKLGKLTSLAGSTQSAAAGDDYSSYGGNAYMYQMMRQQAAQLAAVGGAAAEDEAIGMNPAKVKLSVMVQAHFALE
jgi:uncharacterized protein YggE